MEMTQEQIETEAQNYLNGLDLPENADKQLILDNFKNGMAWAMMLIKEEKQQRIEKENETISNEEKAKEIAKKLSHPNIDSFGDGDYEFDTRFYHTNKDAALQAMQWKDEQFKIVVSKLLKKLAKYDMLDATLCASGLLNLSKQEAQQYIKTLLL